MGTNENGQGQTNSVTKLICKYVFPASNQQSDYRRKTNLPNEYCPENFFFYKASQGILQNKQISYHQITPIESPALSLTLTSLIAVWTAGRCSEFFLT